MRGGVGEFERLARLTMLWVTASFLLAAPLGAFEAFDGRLQVHGFFESQMRAINADFAEQWDLTQWYNILNVELELDIVDEEPFGPIDLLSAFIRVEGRYDCVYTQGCGMMSAANSYGNKSRDLPERLNSSNEVTAAGAIPIENRGRRDKGTYDPLPIGLFPGFRDLSEGEGLGFVDPTDGSTAVKLRDGVLDLRFRYADRPTPFDYTMEEFEDFEFAAFDVIGGSGNGNPAALLGPWLPKNKVRTLNGALTNRVNPVDTTRINPVTLQIGSAALPMRPVPIYNEDPSDRDYTYYVQDNPGFGAAGDQILINRCDRGADPNCSDNPYRLTPDNGREIEARGLFYPSPGLRRYLESDPNTSFNFNFSELERSFNRGASQNDEGELKEAYLDVEMLDSRLWLRLGKQTIVWGKTELFPTVDQWNPQDLALGSLVSLEESRIGLWAFRGVYSFYEVGPLEDFRLEVAMNFDEYESADLGACGEPYTINLVCGLPLGSWAHGFSGIGVAAIEQPENPWDSIKGIEIGARVEFRWDRFSFSISDWWGYDDFPYLKRISTYERNVDPTTGRPRAAGRYGRCTTQDWLGERDIDFTNPDDPVVAVVGTPRAMDPDCLRPGPTNLERFDWASLNPGFANTSRPRPDLPGDRFYALQYQQEKGPDGNYVWSRDADGNLIPNELEREPVANCGRTANCEKLVGGYVANNALENHFANLTAFGFGCSATLAALTVDPASCGLTVFSSKVAPPYTGAGVFISTGLASILNGDFFINLQLLRRPDDSGGGPLYHVLPTIALNEDDPNDLQSLGCVSNTPTIFAGSYQQFGCGEETLGGSSGAGGFGLSLTPEQEALVGCGPFWLTHCRFDGIDLVNADASALMQSFIGMDNALSNGRPANTIRTDNRYLNEWDQNPFYDEDKFQNAPQSEKWRYAKLRRLQPGTLDFMLAETPDGRPVAGAVCTTGDLADGTPFNARTGAGVLPGCRWNKLLNGNGDYVDNPLYDPKVDGDPTKLGIVAPNNVAAYRFPGANGENCLNSTWGDFPDDLCSPVFFSTSDTEPKGHPFTGEQWASELAAFSWNFQTLVISFDDEYLGAQKAIQEWAKEESKKIFANPSAQAEYVTRWHLTYAYTGSQEAAQYLDLERIPAWTRLGEDANGQGIFIPIVDEDGNPTRYLETDHCSFVTPQYCELVQSLMGAAGQKRPTLNAGGNGSFGRRTFVHHSGGEIAIAYQKRNVLGFALDFAEDRTKTNWGIEATWIPNVKQFNNDSLTNVSESDSFSVTIAADRPTFINFLNPNRTFFITTQLFINYRTGYKRGFTSNGPWNALALFFAQTGYFQDRLVANTVFLYDFQSVSGGALASVQYRISENFSLTIGMAAFMGRRQLVDMPINPIAPASNRLGPNAYQDSVENGISAIRDRDELYLRVRYTF